MILSYWTLKERFKVWDIVFIIVSLIGATLTTLGIKENKKLAAKVNDKGFENTKFITIGSMILVPCIAAWSNITSRKMKKLHQLTPGCYMNIIMFFFMAAIIGIKGEYD